MEMKMLKVIVPLSICWILIFTVNSVSAVPNPEQSIQIQICSDKCNNNESCCEQCLEPHLKKADYPLRIKAMRDCRGF